MNSRLITNDSGLPTITHYNICNSSHYTNNISYKIHVVVRNKDCAINCDPGIYKIHMHTKLNILLLDVYKNVHFTI